MATIGPDNPVAHLVPVEGVTLLGHGHERAVQQHRRGGCELGDIAPRIHLAPPDRVLEQEGREAAQVVAPAAERHPDPLVGGGGGERLEDQRGADRVEEGIEVGVDRGRHALHGIADRGDPFGKVRELRGCPRDAQLEEQLLLAGEVAVDQPDRDVRLSRDGGDARAPEAA